MNVLLDLDGTLTDPREGIVGCIRHALTGLGAPCPSDAQLEGYIGPPLHASFGALLGAGSATAARAIELYRERFATKGMFENRVYPEIPAALQALKDLGAVLIVATTKPTTFAERILEHFSLAHHFRAIHGSELDGTRSDKAELIAYILKAQSISPDRTLMVGDRKHDMMGAHANGLFAVGALWGYGSREELVNAGALELCERPGELAKVLSAWISR